MLAQRSTTEGSLYHYYALTISPTKNPTEVPFWKVKEIYKDFLSQFKAGDLEHAFELKKHTDVVHMHCYVRTKSSLFFKSVKGAYKGYQFYFRKVKDEKNERKWCNYLHKEANWGHDYKQQVLWEHAARNISMFD